MKAVLLFLACFCTSMAAQTYTVTSVTGTYAERTTIPSASTWLSPAPVLEIGPKQVVLPFAFQFFGRAYAQCVMTVDGRVVFHQQGAAGTAPTDLSVPAAAQNGTIFAFGAYTRQLLSQEPNAMEAYFEADRVVLQWKGVANISQNYTGYARFNFQCHLRNDHAIELHYGPEQLPTGWTESFQFCSGIVSHDGSQRFAGFGGVLTQQTTKPTPGNRVTLTPLGYTTTIQLAYGHGARKGLQARGKPGDTGVPVLSLEVRDLVTASGGFTGLTVPFTANVTGTMRLLRDNTPLGVEDAGDTVLATQSAGASANFTGFTENIIGGQTRNYLVVVDVTAVSALTTGTSAVSAVGGFYGLHTGDHWSFRTGPMARVNVSYTTQPYPSFDIPAAIGTVGYYVSSFELRAESGSSLAMNSVTLNLTALHGLALADFTEIRLYRDVNRDAAFDIGDVQLGSMSAATTTVFTGLNESATTAGVDYYVIAYLGSGFAGHGELECTLASITTNPATAQIIGNINGMRRFEIIGSAAQTYVCLNPIGYQTGSIPCQPSEINLPGIALRFRRTSGAAPVTSLVFTGVTTGIAAARLYLDTGTLPGVVDAGDTGLTYTTAINANDITFTAITGLTIGLGTTDLVLALDLTAGATGAPQFSFSQTANPALVVQRQFPAVNQVYGPTLGVGIGAAGAGIDLQVTPIPVVDLPLSTPVAAFLVVCTARGAGGFLPDLTFAFPRATGGIGDVNGLRIVTYLEGAGPTNTLDISDTAEAVLSLYGFAHTQQLISLANGQQFCLSGQTRRFLICLRQDGEADGKATMRLVSISGGTNVRIVPSPNYPTFPVAITVDPPAPPTPPAPPEDEDEDGGSCALVADSAPFASPLLALVLTAIAAVRRRDEVS